MRAADSLDSLHLLTYHIYTDGSLQPCSTAGHSSRMDTSWILEDSNIFFICTTTGFFSSTRAELLAILTALLALPESTSAVIHTDSKAAIDCVTPLLSNLWLSTRQWFAANNKSLLGAIVATIKSKQLHITLHKVKVHSDIW